jgi:ribose-phosphate pyrophosphokinase
MCYATGKITIQAYSDGEVGIQVNENVRGKDVYLVQPTCPPGNIPFTPYLLVVSSSGWCCQ